MHRFYKTKRVTLLVGFLCLFITACQSFTPSPTLTLTPSVPSLSTATSQPIPTQSPSRTPTPLPASTSTPGASPTSTRQPTLIAHEWLSKDVLIMAGTRDLDPQNPFTTDIRFLLLSSGQLFLRDCTSESCTYQTAQLNQHAVCSLLNTIDQVGFFDYDPSTFVSPQSGTHKVFIQVNAWKNRSIELDQLDQWLQDPSWFANQIHCSNCFTAPTILPALSNAYYLLQYYRPAKLQSYHPQQLALWLSTPTVSGTPSTWALSAPTLQELYTRSQCSGSQSRQVVVLEGTEADQVAQYINDAIQNGLSPLFTDGSLVLQIVDQWLLPYEAPAGCSANSSLITPTEQTTSQSSSMQCSPADGLVPVITPTPHK